MDDENTAQLLIFKKVNFIMKDPKLLNIATWSKTLHA